MESIKSHMDNLDKREADGNELQENLEKSRLEKERIISELNSIKEDPAVKKFLELTGQLDKMKPHRMNWPIHKEKPSFGTPLD